MKCLEDQVRVLEERNKALIEELKSLRELCPVEQEQEHEVRSVFNDVKKKK